MTEQQWLSSTDPLAMLALLRGSDANVVENWQTGPFQLTDRKLRLFACACCRQPEVWDKLTNDERCGSCHGSGGWWIRHEDGNLSDVWHKCEICSGTGNVNFARRAVEVAERFADGLATSKEREEALRNVRVHTYDWDCNDLVTVAIDSSHAFNIPEIQAMLPANAADLLRDIFGNPFRFLTASTDKFTAFRDSTNAPRSRCEVCRYVAASVAEEESHRKKCFPWASDDVRSIAQQIYDERDFALMHVLGDALEDAGCWDGDVLNHCRAEVGRTEAEVIALKRSVRGCCDRHADNMGCDCLQRARGNIGPHVRGCWVLDLLLRKE